MDNNLIGLLGKHFGLNTDGALPSDYKDQLAPVLEELSGLGMTERELIDSFDSDEVANILAGYELGDSGDLMDPNMDESVETDIVDTTDGVDPHEFDSLLEAVAMLDPAARKRFIAILQAEDNDDELNAPYEGELESAVNKADSVIGQNNGNALAKLIGSLKF